MRRLARYVLSQWWVGVVSLLIAAGLVGVGFSTRSRTGPVRQRIVTENAVEYPVWGAVCVVVGSIGLMAALLLLNEVWRRRRFANPKDRRSRIDRLSRSLRDALRIIDDIKREVEEGSALLEQLEEDAAVKRQLARLSSDDARAVLVQMRETVRTESTRSTWVQFGLNVGFFVAGLLVAVVIETRW